MLRYFLGKRYAVIHPESFFLRKIIRILTEILLSSYPPKKVTGSMIMKFLKCLMVIGMGLGFCEVNDAFAKKTQMEDNCRSLTKTGSCGASCSLSVLGNGNDSCTVNCKKLTTRTSCNNQSSDCSWHNDSCSSKWKVSHAKMNSDDGDTDSESLDDDSDNDNDNRSHSNHSRSNSRN